MEAFFIGVVLTLFHVLLGMGVLSFMEKATNWNTDSGKPLILLVWPIVLIIEAVT